MVFFAKVLDFFLATTNIYKSLRFLVCGRDFLKSIGRSGFPSGFLDVMNLFHNTITYFISKHLNKQKNTDLLYCITKSKIWERSTFLTSLLPKVLDFRQNYLCDFHLSVRVLRFLSCPLVASNLEETSSSEVLRSEGICGHWVLQCPLRFWSLCSQNG